MKFPTFEEAMDGITDSRVVGHAKIDKSSVYSAREGARIMYDRLYVMFAAAPYCSYCEAYHTTETPCLSRR